MSNGGSIRYSVGFDVQQTELHRLKATLQEIQRMSSKDFARLNFDTKDAEGDLARVKKSAQELQDALKKSTNVNLGTVNLAKFNQELKKLDLQSIYKNLSLAGTTGTAAFRNLTTGILQTNVQIKQSNKLLDDMARTLKNTAKWSIASGAMNSFTNSIQQAYGYIKHLDSSLNDIRIVTGYSADEMDRFAEKANKAAKNLAASTTDYTEAALIYYQQGLSGDEVEKRAETTLKTANVTGQSAAEVSEQLTAVWNGYKVSAAETEVYVDKLAAVAASTASDLEELSTGMSKVASAAATSGVDIDQLGATLSTVISVTRQAPESVGTAFKTIYARLGDLAVDGVDEFGTSLGQISSKMKTMGIEILDETGNMRDMGTVVEEVAAKWDTWSSAQKQAAAVAMAGKRQYNNLIALFENWDMYESSLQTSQNSLGTLSEQQEIYLDSAEAKLQQLKTAQEGLYDSLLDADTIKEVAGLLTGLVSGLEHIVDSIGGGSTVLLGLGAVFTKIFNKQLTSSLTTAAMNFRTMSQNAEKLRNSAETVQHLKTELAQVGDTADKATVEIVNMYGELLKTSGVLSKDDMQEFEKVIQNFNEAANAADQYAEAKNRAGSIKAQADDDGINDAEWKKIESRAAALQNEGFSSKDMLKEGMNPEYDKQKKKLKDVKQVADQITQSFQDQKTELLKITTEMTKAEEVTMDMQQNVFKARGELTSTAKALAQHNLLDGTEEQAELEKLIKQVDRFGDEVTEESNKAEKELIQAFQNAVSKILQDIKKVDTALDLVASGYGEVIAQRMQAAIAAVEGQADKIDMTQSMQGLTDVLGAVEMGVFGVTAAWGGLSALWNDDLSTGEKIGQLFTGLLTGATMLIPSIIQLGDAYKKGTFEQIKNTAASLKNMAVGKLKIITTTASAAAEVAESEAIEENTEEINKNTLARIKNLVVQKLQLKGLLKNPYAVAAAAVIGLTLGVIGLTKVLGNNNNELDRAQEATEAARKGFEDTQNAINDINTALDGWNSAVETMRGLEKGTAAWKQQLIEANSHVLTLLDTYPQLAKYITTDDDGLMSISQEGIDLIQEENNRRLETAQTQYAIAQGNEARVQKESVASNLDEATGMSEEIAKSILNYGYENGTGFLTIAESDKSDTEKQQILTQQYDFTQKEAENIRKYSQEIADALAEGAAYATEAEMHTNTVLDSILSQTEGYETLNSAEQKIAQQKLQDVDYDTKFEQQYRNRKSLDVNVNRNDYQEYVGASSWRETDEGDIEYNIKGTWTAVEDSVAMLELATNDTSKALGDVATSAIEAAKKLSKIQNDLLMGNNSQKGKRKEMSENEANAIVGASKEDGLDGSNISDVELDNLLMGTGGKTGNDYLLTKDAALNAGFTEEDAAEAGYTGENALVEYFQAWLNEQAHELKAQREEEKNNKIDELVSDEGNGLNSAANQITYGDEVEKKDFETAGFTNDDVQNWDAISEHLNQNTIATEGWAAALREAKEEYTKVTETQAEVNKALAEAEAEGFDTEVIKQHARALMENNEAFKDNEALATKAAVAQQKQQRGMEKLTDGWEDYSDVLKDAEASEAEIAKVSVEVMDGLADIYDLTDEELEMLPPDFAKDNLDLIEDVKNGVEGAYEQLLAKIGQETVIGLKLDPNTETELSNAIDGIANAIDTKDLQIGASLDDTGYTATLNNMLDNGKMTAADITAALEAMQFSPDISYKEVPANTLSKEWLHQKAEIINPETGETETVTLTSDHMNNEKVMVRVPVINGANTKYTGGGAPRASSGGSGGGGGGGGGTSKAKKTYKKTERKRDRYREVNNSLKKVETELGRLNKEQERLFGKDLLDNLNEQTEILEKQISLSEKKLAIAEKEAAEMRNSVKNERKGYYNDLKDFGIVFDKNNNITNYQEKMKALDDEIARKNRYFNSKSAKWQESTAGKKYAKKIERLEANRDTLETLKEEYDTLLFDTIPGIVDEITDAAYQQIELKMEAFQIEADLRLDVTEAKRDWADFESELAEFYFPDNLLKQNQPIFDMIQSEMGNMVDTVLADGTTVAMTGTANALYDEITTWTTEWQKYRANPSAYTNTDFLATNADGTIQKDEDGNPIFNEVAFREALQESGQDIQDYILDMEESFQQLNEAYLDSIDAVAEGYEEQLETLEYIGNQLEHNIRMTELLKGENAYEDLAENYKLQRANIAAEIQDREEQIQYYKARMDAETDEKAKEQWRELYLTAIEDYESSLETAAEIIQSEFENAVNLQLQKFDEALGAVNDQGDFLGTRSIKSQWEIDTGNAEKYLDTVEKTYGIQNFANKVNQGIAETDSLPAQRKLNKLLDEQLKKLREKDKLTKYDLDRANALYELELKKIALEEAQNNKSQMRLRRDSSGNYSYQFVADDNSIAQAQQELLDAQNNLYNLDKEAMQERQGELWDVYQEYQDLMVEYAQLSAEEREKYEDEYAAKFTNLQQRMVDLGTECADIQVNLTESATSTMTEAYRQMGEEIGNFTEDILPAWSTGMDELIAKINNPDGSFKAAMESVFEEVKKLSGQASQDMADLGEKSAEAYTEANTAAGEWRDAAVETTAELKTQCEQLGELNKIALEYRDTWKEIADYIIEAAKAANDYYVQTSTSEADNINNSQNDSTGGDGGSSGSGDQSSTKKDLTDKRIRGIAEAIVRDGANTSGWKKGETRKTRINRKFKQNNDTTLTPYEEVQEYVNDLLSGAVKGVVSKANRKNYYYSKFDTGGYTGEWTGTDGKMAMLHQKELVLNQADTKNLLSAIYLLRNMAQDSKQNYITQEIQKLLPSNNNLMLLQDSIDIQKQIKDENILSNNLNNSLLEIVNAMSVNMDNLIRSLEPHLITGSEIIQNENSATTTNIDIHADFPNANSAIEIEKAFTNLVNMATQRAFSDRK